MLTKMTEEDWVIVRDQQDSRSFLQPAQSVSRGLTADKSS